MCTYKLSINDALIDNAKKTFPNQTEITLWMQSQIERLLKQMATPEEKESRPLRTLHVSERIKALSAVPPCTSDIDYKSERMEVLSDKY